MRQRATAMALQAGQLLRPALLALFRLVRTHWIGLLLLFGGLLLPLWLFATLAEEVHEAGELVLDRPLLELAQRMARDGFDRVFLFFSAIGYSWGVVPFSAGLVVALAAARHFRKSAYAAVTLGGAGLLNMAAKQAFARDRPDLWESIAPEPTYSFPSGHAMGSMTLAVVAVLLAWPTRWRWPVLAAMLVFVPMVGLSRVYLGVHYPSDILAGWTAATAWAVGCYVLAFGTPRLHAWWRARSTRTPMPGID
jgi:membrane-associated phospholipid phosphatase